MTNERIVELELFIEREMKGNEALTNDPGCVARAKIDRDILVCLEELQAHREAWEKVRIELKQENERFQNKNNFASGYIEGIREALCKIGEYKPKEE